MKKFTLLLVMCFLFVPIAFGDLVIYEPESGSTVGIEDVVIEWSPQGMLKEAHITVRDVTSNELLIDKAKLNGDYTIHHNFMVDGHTYKVTIVMDDYEKVQTLSTLFTVSDDESKIIEPVFKNPNNMETPKKDVTIGWQADYSADHYLISVFNLTTDEIIISKHELDEDDNEYEIDGSLLEPVNEYQVTVTTVKGKYSRSAEMVFYVTDKDLEQPDIIEPKNNSTWYLSNIHCVWNSIDKADHYIIDIDDLTTGEESIIELEVEKNSYTIDQEKLKEGHEYKINFAAVIGKEEKWNSSTFKIAPPALVTPSLKNLDRNEIVPYEELLLRWEKTGYIDYYRLEITDTDLDQMVLSKKVDTSRYSVSKEVLTPGHHYEITVTTVRGKQDRKKVVPFSVESVDLSALSLVNPKSEYHHEYVVFEWNKLEGIETYKISIQDLNSKEIILSDFETAFNSYQLSTDLLKQASDYRMVLSCDSTDDQKIITHDFKTKAIISTWAKPFVDSVQQESIISPILYESLVSKPKNELTRVDFCEMLVSLYETYENPYVELDINNSKLFSDIDSLSEVQRIAVLKANALGIVSGTSETTFNPLGLVSREEMAVMLKNTYHAMAGDVSYDKIDFVYKDNEMIADWAKDSVKFSYDLSILEGDGESFNPKSKASNEMAFVLLDKMIKLTGKKE